MKGYGWQIKALKSNNNHKLKMISSLLVIYPTTGVSKYNLQVQSNFPSSNQGKVSGTMEG